LDEDSVKNLKHNCAYLTVSDILLLLAYIITVNLSNYCCVFTKPDLQTEALCSQPVYWFVC